MIRAKIDILSKAQTRKMTPYEKKEQKEEKRRMTIQTTTKRHRKNTIFLKSLW